MNIMTSKKAARAFNPGFSPDFKFPRQQIFNAIPTFLSPPGVAAVVPPPPPPPLTGNSLLASTGHPIFSVGTTPILVK